MSSKIMKYYVNADRIRIIVILFFILSFLTFSHNYRLAIGTTDRDFSYNSWQILTKNSNLFEEVKTRDILISSNQNDAYETNAGSFYYNTGIRLVYLFNTVSIWPNYSTCLLEKNCALTDVRHKVITVLPNLERGPIVASSRTQKLVEDWVSMNMKPGALDNSKIWDFDIYLMTPRTMIAFLAPYDESKFSASVKLRQLRFVTISSSSNQEFSPAISNICLVRDSSKGPATFSQNGLKVTYWRVPTIGRTPNGKPTFAKTSIDIRTLNTGTC